MTPDAQRKFDAAKVCDFCHKGFGKGAKFRKCRNHNHVTGEYRRALCNVCNARHRNPPNIKVFTRNGTGCDHHFYLRSLVAVRAQHLESV